MGRYAQAKRRGGGPTTEISMIAAVLTDSGNGLVTAYYNAVVDAAQFGFNAFRLEDVTPSISVQQDTPTSLDLDFATDATGTTFIKYVGNTPGVRPQQVMFFD